jgi:CubicO group peptidase (beta-lactamase class C family)
MSRDVPIGGVCDPKFSAVEEAFRRNMAEGDPECGEELGACVAIVIDGEPVVDLWGGYRDAARTRPWEADTITCMMSVTKACAGLALLKLVDDGRIELDAPVGNYWPAFARNGKEAMTVRTLVSHQSGVIYADGAPAGSLWDVVSVQKALEEATPEWEPGTGGAYHSFTYGPLVDAMIRHVDGRDVGDFWREEIADRVGIDFHIGLIDAEAARRAEYVQTPGTPSRDGIKGEAESPLTRAWRPLPRDEDFNSENWIRKPFGSANGHGNARAIATLYSGLAGDGTIGGARIVSRELIAEAIAEHWDDLDRMTNRPFRFGCAFMLSSPPFFPFGGQCDNFGHVGIGGAIGFGDPHRGLGFSYCGNRMAPIADTGPFATPLIDAMYASL